MLGRYIAFLFTLGLAASGAPAEVRGYSLPGVPEEALHPGSKSYPHSFKREDFKCFGRDVTVYLPVPNKGSDKFSVVVYGHGQALGVDSYEGTLIHLARKGVAAIFPTYDSGFFDQDWRRMAHDFVRLSDCALARHSDVLDRTKVIFSGHSKGAYVAGIASGLAQAEQMTVRPRATILFQSAGWDQQATRSMNPAASLTVIYSDEDRVVDRGISMNLFRESPCQKRQYIEVKSYSPQLKADHFWPLTKGGFFGGGPESPLHYYGSWKWLVATAYDLDAGGDFSNPYIYGDRAGDKGISSLSDEIQRSY